MSGLGTDRFEQRHTLLHQLGAFDDGVRHVPHLRRERGHLEQPDRFGGLLHLIDGIVHRGDQVADVAAIERRDEGAPNRNQHLAGGDVGILLTVLAINLLSDGLSHYLDPRRAVARS